MPFGLRCNQCFILMSIHHMSRLSHLISVGQCVALLIVLASLHFQTFGKANPSKPYELYLRTYSKELLRKGNYFLYEANQPDSAMFCFTIVAERIHDSMTQKEKEDCFAGWCGRCETNNWGYNNYEGCIQDYNRLKQSQSQWGIESAKPLYFLAIYSVYEYNNDPKNTNFDEVRSLMKTAFRKAVALRDKDLSQRIFDNLLRVSMFNGNDVLFKEMKMLQSLFKSDKEKLRLSELLHSSVIAYRKTMS